jgi:hypothetical protein
MAVHAERLTLLVADSKAGYFGVHLSKPGQPKPYQAKVRRGGKEVHLGSFATAEEHRRGAAPAAPSPQASRLSRSRRHVYLKAVMFGKVSSRAPPGWEQRPGDVYVYVLNGPVDSN